MRLFVSRSALVLATLLVVGCGVTIGELNLRPDKYYQEKVKVTGRITRLQSVDGGTLLELADPREHRLLVKMATPVTQAIGDWVKASGVLVPEAKVGDQVLYDVLVAEDVSGTGAPWFPNLM
jgi:hypothetical protein